MNRDEEYSKNTPICEQRMETEKKLGRPLRVTYGPNNKVYGPNKDEVNKMVDGRFLEDIADTFFYICARVNLVIVRILIRLKILKGN